MGDPLRRKGIPNGGANGSFTPKGGPEPIVIEGADADPALWAGFRSSYQEGGEDGIRRARRYLRELYERWDIGATGSSIVELTEDSQTGIFAGAFEPNKDYSSTGLRPLFIKKVPVIHGEQALRDWQYIQTHGYQPNFRLSPVEASLSYPEDGYSLLVTQPIIGPTVGKIFRALDYVIEGHLFKNGQTEIAKELKEEIIRQRLKYLAWWAAHMGEAVPERIRITDPKAIVTRYKDGIRNAFENATRYTTDGQHSFILSNLEREILECASDVYHQLNLGNRRIVRIRDDTDANCGIELGRMEFSDSQELANRTIDALTYEPTPGAGRKVDSTGIEKLFGNWDTGNPNFGHVEEDLWRTLDSASAKISDADKKIYLINFLRQIFGEGYESHDIPLDGSLVRTFRNWRHRDVVITLFSARNEQRYEAQNEHANDDSERSQLATQRDQRRQHYQTTATHYAQMSLEGLASGIRDLQNKIGKFEEGDMGRQLLDGIEKSQSILRKGNGPQSSADLEIPLKSILSAFKSPRPDMTTLASLGALHVLMAKAAHYSQIDYASLPNKPA